MANILKALSIIANSSAKDNLISQEHQFLGTIIGHLDYLFERIVFNKIQRQPQKVEVFQNSQPITTQKKQNEDIKPISVSTNQKDTKMMDQMQAQEENESEVPSIQQVSNFGQQIEEKSSSQSYKKKKIQKQKKLRNKSNKVYKNAKKPVSSFVFYYKERLKQIQQQKYKNNQSISIGNLAKIISKQWKQLSQREKRPYVIKAEHSLKTYYSEKEKISNKFLSRHKKSQGPAQKIDENIDKGPLTSFFIYFKENSERISRQYGQHQRVKLAKIASDQWKKLSIVQKMKYEKLYLKNKSKLNKKDEQKITVTHNIRKKKNKNEQEEYKPKLYRCKTSRNLQKNKKNISSDQENEEVDKQQREAKQVEIIQENKQIVTQKEAKILENKVIKQQYPQPSLKSESQDKKIEKAEQNQNCMVIEVDSDDQLSCIFSQKLEENDDESYFQNNLNKIEQNKGKKIKGPISPFLLYYQKVINKLRMTNNAHGSQLVRLASAKWAELSENEKAIYQSLAKKSREKYSEEVVKEAIRQKKESQQ